MQGLTEYCLQIPAHLFCNLGEGMLRLCFNFQSILIHNLLGSKYLGKSVTKARQQSKHSRVSASPGLILVQLPDFFDALKLGSYCGGDHLMAKIGPSETSSHPLSSKQAAFFWLLFPQVLGYTIFVSGADCSFAATAGDFPNVPVPIT